MDDPRNTGKYFLYIKQKAMIYFFNIDNSWMETEAVNMHDETGELTKNLKLEAGKFSSLNKIYF